MIEITPRARLTKYEKARLVGSRALQIAMGAPFLVKLTKKKLEEIQFSPIEIAKMELVENVVPMTVVRPLPKAKVEDK